MANGIRTGDPVDSIKDVVPNSVKIPDFDKHLKKAGEHIGRNVVEITIKMKTRVRKAIMIHTHTRTYIYIYIYEVTSISFQTFFVQTFKNS